MAMMSDGIDPKILKVIHLIIKCGSATEAAHRLNMSTGNISYLLGKARKITGAHLFIRTNKGLRPDTTALELSQRYLQYFESNQCFKQGKVKRNNSLTINAHSLMEMVFCSDSLKENDKKYDELRYQFKSYICDPAVRLSNIKNKLVDIDIGDSLLVDSELNSIKLFTSEIGIITNKKSRSKGTPFSYKEWCASRHVVWSSSPTYYCTSVYGSQERIRFDKSRDVAVVSGSLINMVSLCSNTNYIMLVPKFFSRFLEKRFLVNYHPLEERVKIYCDQYLHYNTVLSEDHNVMELIEQTISQVIGSQK